MVAIDSHSSVPPHIQPPIAQVPSPMRDNSRVVPAIFVVSMVASDVMRFLVTSSVIIVTAHLGLGLKRSCRPCLPPRGGRALGRTRHRRVFAARLFEIAEF